jgi:hypothetical protein
MDAPLPIVMPHPRNEDRMASFDKVSRSCSDLETARVGLQ